MRLTIARLKLVIYPESGAAFFLLPDEPEELLWSEGSNRTIVKNIRFDVVLQPYADRKKIMNKPIVF